MSAVMKLNRAATTVARTSSCRPARFVRAAVAPEGQTPAEVAPETAIPQPAPVPAAAPALSFNDVMGFSGSAPEIVNGRLAMLGFVSAAGAELASGEGVLKQLSEQPVGIALAFALFIAASLVPAFKNSKGEKLGPFTPQAELLNGRAAMIGFAALVAIEAVKGSALI